MTIDKAIEILTTWMETGEAASCSDLHIAEKLAIEALKRCKVLAANNPLWAAKPLPGAMAKQEGIDIRYIQSHESTLFHSPPYRGLQNFLHVSGNFNWR